MDMTFNCPKCKTEMVVDTADAGRQADCPACGAAFTIPDAQATNIHSLNPIATSAAAKENRHYAVPQHDAPSEVLIEKPNKPLEVAAKETDKKIKIKTIRRTDCVEVGHDCFDERVSEFLAHVGEGNIVNISTIAYTHLDLGSRQLMTDFGVLITYKG